MMEFWENPAVVGLIIALPAFVLGYLGYRRSQGIDAAAKQVGIETGNTATIGQIIKALQDDNRTQREEMGDCRARLDAIESGNADLRAKNRELESEIRVLHAENAALKVENEGLKARIGGLEEANGKGKA